MLNDSIPGLTKSNPTLPRELLEAKLKSVDQRRAAIEEIILHKPSEDIDYASQELQAEYAALNSLRTEINDVLNPRPQAKRHPNLQREYDAQRKRDKQLLKDGIKQQIQQIEWNADRESEAGNHRQAKLLRLTLHDVPEQVAKEYGLPLSLLAELET